MKLEMVYSLAVLAAGSWFFLLAVSNAIFFKLSQKKTYKTTGPLVSVLIPARNEEKRLPLVLNGLKNQRYAPYEVLVIDDNSTDGTWEFLEGAAAVSDNLKILKAAPLPSGWKGKPHAMTQLAAKAQGEILLFLDADMDPGRDFIPWVVEGMTRHGADSLSGYAQHRARNVREYLFFPLIYMVNMGFLPFWLIKSTKSPLFSHAIGQIMAFRKDSYHAAGGFGVVRDEILEDIQMARVMKGKGFRHIFLDAKKVLSGYMYDSWEHLKLGLERSIFEYFDKKIYPIIIMTFFLFALLIAPPFVTAASFFFGWSGSWHLLSGTLLTLLAWSITLFDRGIPLYVALPYPVLFFYLLILSWISLFNGKTGRGYLWKDRQVV